MNKLAIFFTLLLLAGCSNSRFPVVQEFNLDEYLGHWHEIARIDNRFERGLSQVSAEYILEENTIKVINRGYSASKDEWREAIGKARFEGANHEGRLEVSFFGPFYGSYQILHATRQADGRYQTALVAGNDLSYLWVLSRNPALSSEEKRLFTDKIAELGIEPTSLLWFDAAESLSLTAAPAGQASR